MNASRSLGIVASFCALTLVACGGGASLGPGGVPTAPSSQPTASPLDHERVGGASAITPSPGSSATASASPLAPTATATDGCDRHRRARSPRRRTATAPVAVGDADAGSGDDAAGRREDVRRQPRATRRQPERHDLSGDGVGRREARSRRSRAATRMLAQPYFDVGRCERQPLREQQRHERRLADRGLRRRVRPSATSRATSHPTSVITGLHNPTGARDRSRAGNLYVAVVDAIGRLRARSASGNATCRSRVIGGSSTTLQNLVVGGQPYALALDSAGDVYTAMGPAVLEFGPAASGNVAPLHVYGGVNGGNPATTGPAVRLGDARVVASSVAVDAASDVYCAKLQQQQLRALHVAVVAGRHGRRIRPERACRSASSSIPTGQVFVADSKSDTVRGLLLDGRPS